MSDTPTTPRPGPSALERPASRTVSSVRPSCSSTPSRLPQAGRRAAGGGRPAARETGGDGRLSGVCRPWRPSRTRRMGLADGRLRGGLAVLRRPPREALLRLLRPSGDRRRRRTTSTVALLVAGAETDVCVLRVGPAALLDRGLQVFLLKDCLFGADRVRARRCEGWRRPARCRHPQDGLLRADALGRMCSTTRVAEIRAGGTAREVRRTGGMAGMATAV